MQAGPLLAIDALSGFILGLFLGPLGMILAGFLKPTVELQAKRDVADRRRVRPSGSGCARKAGPRPAPRCSRYRRPS